MTDLFQRRTKSAGRTGNQPAAARRLTLGAFGKHPGWDDHVLGLGPETDTLAQVKQALYVGGIGGQIDSGAWETLDAEKRLQGFDHAFLWLRPAHVIVGRLWSSTDGKGRSKYPMVVCIDGEGISPEFMVTSLLPGLERLREACKATTSAEQVRSDCRAAQEQLEKLPDHGGAAEGPTALTVAARRRFLERAELGPDRLGFLRVLHEINAAIGLSVRGKGLASGAAGSLRSCHLRLPFAGESPNDALLLWASFLICVVAEPRPLLLIARAGESWLDAVIGEASRDDFFCFQASLKALPLVTDIPYQLASDAKHQLAQIEARFLGVEAPSAPAPASTPAPAPKQVTAPATAAGSSSSEKRRSKLPFLVGGGLLLAVAIVGVYMTGLGRRSSPPPPKVEIASGQEAKSGQAKPSKVTGGEAPERRSQQVVANQTLAQREKDLDDLISRGEEMLRATNYAQAKVEFEKAVTLAAELKDADTKKKKADEGQRFAGELAKAKSAGRVEDRIGFLEAALKVRPDGNVEQWLRQAREEQRRMTVAQGLEQKKNELSDAIAKGEGLLRATNYAEAAVEFQKAVTLATELNDANKKKQADEGQRFAGELAKAKSAGRVEDRIGFLEAALHVRKDDKVGEWLRQAREEQKQTAAARGLEERRRELGDSIAKGEGLLGATNYAAAGVEFQKAVTLAAELKDADKRKQAEAGQRFAGELAKAKSAGRVEDQIRFLEAALKLRKDAKVEQWLAQANQRKGQIETATAQAQKCQEARAGAEKAEREGQWEVAVQQWQEAQKVCPAEAAINDSIVFAAAITNVTGALKQARGLTNSEPERAMNLCAGALAQLQSVERWGVGGVRSNTLAALKGELQQMKDRDRIVASKPPPPPVDRPPFTNSFGMEFVWISRLPGGGAFVGKYEVTQKQFLEVMGKLPDGQFASGDQLPVANVGFEDANRFCERLSRDGKRCALPSKADWLAAAGLTPEQVTGGWELLEKQGVLAKEVTSLNAKSPARAGSFGPQSNGLCDLFGNLREWVIGVGEDGKPRGESAGFSYYSPVGRSKALFVPQAPWMEQMTGFRCILRESQ